jgi:hypothetical protein
MLWGYDVSLEGNVFEDVLYLSVAGDQRSACFDKLSMRLFSMPWRFFLILSLSKDARH